MKKKDEVRENKVWSFIKNKVWPIIYVLLLAVVLMSIGDILGGIVSVILEMAFGLPEKYTIFFDYFATFGPLLVFILYFVWSKKDHDLLAKFKLKRGHFLIGLVIGGTLNVTCAFAAMLHKDLVLTPIGANIIGLLIALVLVCIQSTSEEVICRLFVYEKLAKKYKSVLVPIIVNSLFFAALHLGNDGITVLGFIDMIVYAVFMSFCIYYLDSLWMAAAIHTSWNFMQNFILGLPNSGIPSTYSIYGIVSSRSSEFYNVVFGVEGTVFCVLLTTLSCILMYLIFHKKKSV